jgi:hypothetical protein
VTIETIRSAGYRFRAAARELLLVAALFMAYKAGRIVAMGHAGQAKDNASSIWHFERLLHLPDEASLQHALLSHEWLIHLANSYYAYVHFPTTALCLIWLYLRRPEWYLWTRRLLAWRTAAALVVHLAFPLAPPRLSAATGLVDTGTLYGPGVYGHPDTDTLSNQYAAMPSLHVGWALVVALALIGATRGRLRRLWLLHPVITLLVVAATGNHYWLDAVVAVALLALIATFLPAVRAADEPVPRTGGYAIVAQRRRGRPALHDPGSTGPEVAIPELKTTNAGATTGSPTA